MCIPITGCSINPTRSFGPSVVADHWAVHWIWWAAPLVGSLSASLFWLLMRYIDFTDASAAAARPASSSTTAAYRGNRSHALDEDGYADAPPISPLRAVEAVVGRSSSRTPSRPSSADDIGRRRLQRSTSRDSFRDLNVAAKV